MSNRALLIIFGALFAFFVVTNVAPNLLIIPMLLLVGIPLLFVNTVFVYYLAALPALALINVRPRNWFLVAGAATLIPLVAIVPPWRSEKVTAEYVQARFFSGDMEGAFPAPPKSIELVGGTRSYGGRNSALNDAPCDALCQKLLLSRQVDVVRVTRGTPTPTRPNTLEYVLESRETCPDAFGNSETMLPETKFGIASGLCVVPRKTGAETTDARIEITNTKFPDPKDLSEDLNAATDHVKSVQVLKIWTAESGRWPLTFQKTQVTYSYWMTPLFMFPANCHGMCVGMPVFRRSERTLNSFDPTEAALRALGVSETPPSAGDPADLVMSMLDRAGETLTDNQKQLIRDWTASVSCTFRSCQITDKDREVLMRLVGDRRVADFIAISGIVQRGRFVEGNLDLFLDEMESRGSNTQFSAAIGAIVAQQDIEQLRARRDRILRLIQGNDWKWSHGLGIVTGRLGLDTTGLIAERLQRGESAETAALAACTADDAIGEALVPALLAYLDRQPVGDSTEAGPRTAVKALSRFGHLEEAKALFLAKNPTHGEFRFPRQSAADVVTDVSACYRG